jgi:hypothetical protein
VVLLEEPEPVVPVVPEPELVEPEVPGLVVLDPELPMPEVLLLDDPLAPMPELLVLLPGEVVDVLALGVTVVVSLRPEVRVVVVAWQPAASAAAAARAMRDRVRCDAVMVTSFESDDKTHDGSPSCSGL